MRTRPRLLFLAACCGLVSRLAAAEPSAPVPGTADCKVIQTVPAVFPERLQNAGVTRGEARVVLQVDPAGRLTDSLVTAYTHRAFADEARRVAGQWRFEPGRIDGEPVGSIIEVTFLFQLGGMSVLVRHGSARDELNLPAGRYEFQTASLRELDRIPVPLAVAPPPYPKAWADRGVKGKVTVEFFIDETGRARMPAVIAGDNRRLGGVAVATVQQWRFSPPTRAGAPTLVKAQQDFSFGSP